SSRRRHTRFSRDWSSDVCSSDLRLRRLYRLVEEGSAEADDLLKERMAAIRAERDAAKAALDRAVSGKVPGSGLDPATLVRFGQRSEERRVGKSGWGRREAQH